MSGRSRAPRWQRGLAFAVGAFIIVGSPPLWAGILLASLASGAILAGPLVAARRRRRPTVAAQPPGDVTVLGTSYEGEPVWVSDRQLGAHTVIVGASGSGKSTTLLTILAEQVRRGKGLVAIDMKGSPAFAATLEHAAARAGRPFYLWTPDGPSAWNPLAYGNPTELKDKLISMERFSEIHYQRAAERYLQVVLQVLRITHAGGPPPTLSDVVELMDPARLQGQLRALSPLIAHRVQRYLTDELTPDQLSAVRGLGTRLAIITESHTGQYLGGPAFEFDPEGAFPPARAALDLRAALRGDQVVVFSLNSSSYAKLAAQLGALVLRDVITVVGELTTHPEQRHPAMVALDEFSGLNGDQIVDLQQRCREAEVGFAVTSQEPTDFERAARGLLDQILGNTAVKISHRLDVPKSAELVADLAGTETVWEETHQFERHPFFGTRATGRSTARQVERFVIHPNVIKSLPTGHAVVITKVPETRAQLARITPPPSPQNGAATSRELNFPGQLQAGGSAAALAPR